MAQAKTGTKYVCGVCGTTLLVTDSGFGLLEDIVCCEKPMVPKAAKTTKKAKPKKKAKKK